MYEENYFVPKILLRGDKTEFLARVGQRPFKLVGEINFVGEAEGQQFHLLRDKKFSLDGKLKDYQELSKILKVDADYFVFNNSQELGKIRGILYKIGCVKSQLVSLHEFKTMQRDAFYDLDSDNQLMIFLKEKGVKTLFDVDAHFAKSQLLTKGINDVTEIDCISKEELLPIKENIYGRVYKKFSDCQFRHYDAALVYGQNNVDFMTTFSALDGMTDVVITFARYDSDFEKYLAANVNFFERINVVPSFAGRWIICRRHSRTKDFAMYVVTHKALPAEYVEKFPEGYKVIHAGRAISADSGYLGDNTGDNISHLNPYLNELTALYWMWKNTNHSIIGLSHYRRFFTESADSNFSHDKILTAETAEKILRDYDIIVNPHFGEVIQFDNILLATNKDATELVSSIIKKNLSKNFPDYVEMFDAVMNSRFFYKCEMFIARKNIIEAYFKWLFSFIIDTCEEFLKNILENKSMRLVGYFNECMMTVWLLKNNLRIKEMNIMVVPNL